MTENTEKRAGKTMLMTEGSPVKIIFLFAIPIFLGIVLQNLYNIVDTAIAGHLLGDGALAAIGAIGTVYNTLVSFALGLNNGFSLLISRAFGSRDREGMNRAVTWTLVLNLMTVAVLTAASLVFLDPLLRAMNTPAEIRADAKTYLLIILTGFPVTMAYNMGASVLRSMGNSTPPLVCLAISCALNVVLNLIFVLGFHRGVAGLAAATVTAQLASAAYCLWYIVRRYPEIRPARAYLRPPKGYVGEMFLTRLSMGMMTMIVSFGSIVLQAAVNKLGSLYIAGQISGTKIEVFFMGMLGAFSNSIATYVSQNYGAGERRRIRQGVYATLEICAAFCVVCAVFALTPLCTLSMKLVTGSETPEVINSGALFIRVTLLTSPFLCLLLTLRNTLQGMGHKIVPLFASAVEMGGKLLFAWALVPRFGYTAVCFCEPALWVLCSVFLIFVIIRFRGEFRDEAAEAITQS